VQRINLHTHCLTHDESLQVLNVFAQDLKNVNSLSLYSTGLHPWHILENDTGECLLEIEKAGSDKRMIAIGECGLDRLISTDFEIQKSVFRKQIDIAEKLQKPLIIHCVRAVNELIAIKKQFQSKVPWIIHGFTGNQEITKNLIRHGFYFSVGEPMLKDQRKYTAFKEIPIERLFMETDDRNISIKNIYLLAAQIREIDEVTLIESIHNNFKTVFSDVEMVATN
jgi:TatD DNase family protein